MFSDLLFFTLELNPPNTNLISRILQLGETSRAWLDNDRSDSIFVFQRAHAVFSPAITSIYKYKSQH
jgi:hypothetical protein